MFIFISILVVAGLIACIADWRSGMFICILAGFLADIIRKVTPDQPVYFVVLVGFFVAAVVAGFVRQHGVVDFTKIRLFRNSLGLPLVLFLAWLVIQSIVSMLRYGSLPLVGIGLLSYVAPLPGFLIAYYYGLRVQSAVDFVKFYVICAVLMVSGVFLSFGGFESPLLEEVGSGVLIHVPGGFLDSYPGFLRSTEGAAWHAAAAISLTLVLTVSGVVRWPKWIAGILILALLLAGLLTGRRKMLMEVLIFAGMYGILLSAYRRELGRLMVVGLIMAGLLGVAGLVGLEERTSAERPRLDLYVERGATVFEEADDRFAELGLGSVGWAVSRYGFFGGGLGVASQGGQHFGGGGRRFGGAGEGGLGKIVSELGVPGLLLVLWLAGAIVLYLRRVIPVVSRLNDPIVPFFLGLVAFLGANIPVFIVATQIFGDPFVLLLLGWILGFSMAISEVLLILSEGGRPGADEMARRMLTPGESKTYSSSFSL